MALADVCRTDAVGKDFVFDFKVNSRKISKEYALREELEDIISIPTAPKVSGTRMHSCFITNEPTQLNCKGYQVFRCSENRRHRHAFLFGACIA